LEGIGLGLILLFLIGQAFETKEKNNFTNGEENPFKSFNIWLNSFFFPDSVVASMNKTFGANANHVLTYLRDLGAGYFLYFTVAGIWSHVVYSKGRFLEVQEPTKETLVDQMLLASMSLPCYAMLPVFSQIMIEEGYTKVYYSVSEVGGVWGYIVLTTLYLAFVEIGIYWVHRTLHTNKFLYKYVHALHHKYNKPSTLTPWASIAFNPLDGILQASPYVVGLFLIPCHYISHLLMLFFTSIWATNIHDTLDGNYEPIMGSKYHLIHHTHYHCNFGQFFTVCDWIWGTLKRPEDLQSRIQSQGKRFD